MQPKDYLKTLVKRYARYDGDLPLELHQGDTFQATQRISKFVKPPMMSMCDEEERVVEHVPVTGTIKMEIIVYAEIDGKKVDLHDLSDIQVIASSIE